MKKQKDLEFLIFIKLAIPVFLAVLGGFLFLKSIGAIIIFSTNIWEVYKLYAVTKYEMRYHYFFAVFGLAIFILSIWIVLDKKKQLKDYISRNGKDDEKL